MKNFYFSLLSLFGVLSVNAQLTQANHAPASGDTYQMYRCDSSSAITPGPSGANAMWNYSGITTYSSLVRSYTAQTSGSPTYPQANIILASAINDASYLSSTTNTLGYYGGNISVGTVAGSLTYTAPAILASYPMSLNTASATTIGGTVAVTNPFPTTGTFLGNSNVLVDGSGTISLPGGITYNNVLRVVTSQTIVITAFATATVYQTVYDYYASGIKAPVFSINTSTANAGSITTNTYVSRNKNLTAPPVTTVSVSENISESSYFNAFPNPSNAIVNFVTNHPDAKFISVYDITGKLVEKQNLAEGKLKVDVSSYNKGIYLYTVSSGENRTLKSGKITVSQQ